MNRIARFSVAVALLGAALPSIALARPNYKMVFTKAYEIKPESNLGKASCNACHAGTDKKVRNAYGMQLEKALGKEGATDDEFTAALKAVEAKEVKFTILDVIKGDKGFDNAKEVKEVKEEKDAKNVRKLKKSLRAKK
jgi:hypothetical protein